MHVFLQLWCTKSLSKAYKKNCVLEFLPLSAREHVYTYRRQEFKNILEKKLLWTVVTYLIKNVKHGIEHHIDRADGAFVH